MLYHIDFLGPLFIFCKSGSRDRGNGDFYKSRGIDCYFQISKALLTNKSEGHLVKNADWINTRIYFFKSYGKAFSKVINPQRQQIFHSHNARGVVINLKQKQNKNSRGN